MPSLSRVAADDPEKEGMGWAWPGRLSDGLSCDSVQGREGFGSMGPSLPLDMRSLKEEGRGGVKTGTRESP